MQGRVELSPSTWRQEPPGRPSAARAAVLRHVADRIEALGRRRARVAVDGRTAAGKTTFGHELAAVLADAGRVVLRASLDDFKRPWADRHLYDRVSGAGYYRNAFDLDAIRELLLDPAADDASGLVALCCIDPLTQRSHAHTRVVMPSDGILIVDGVFALRPALRHHWDLGIWLDIGPELSIQRGTNRDASRDGAAAAETLHRERYGPAEAIYLAEADPIAAASIVVDNTELADPRILRG